MHPVNFIAGYISEDGSLPPPLTPEEEMEYFRRYKEGNKEAKDNLVIRNLKLVLYVINQYSTPDQNDYNDLFSVGIEGLMKAITNFKPERKSRFSCFAIACIENEILMNFRKIKKTRNDVSLYQSHEIGKDGTEVSWVDTIPDTGKTVEEIVETGVLKKILRFLILETLGGYEQDVLILRYGINDNKERTQEEVAKTLKISRAYVSRLESRAIRRLRERFMW